jgi:hypothetical protein
MLLWDGTVLSVLGLLAAIPPMVLFVSAVINPNGLEIAAAIAFAAALLRVTRAPAARWIWVALAVSGAVTILSWQLGPAFVVLESLVVWGLGPHEHGDARILAGIRAHWLTLAVLACSFVAYMAWGAASGLFHSAITITPLGPNLLEGVRQMKDVLFQSVGVFGRLTVTLPTALYWVWFALVATLGTGAMIVGDRRQRVTLSGSVLLAFAFPVLFQAWAHHGTGFSMQGRYVLPLLGLVPMVSGEILVRRAERLPATVVKRVTALLVATIGAFQVFAWWTAASTAAGFAHAAWFLRNPLWHPPLTWWPWVILALCGGLAFAAAGQRWRPVLPALRTRAGVSS